MPLAKLVETSAKNSELDQGPSRNGSKQTSCRTDGAWRRRRFLRSIFKTGLFACANRCPHKGYPLSEGALTDECILTCNWHNWNFDLSSGETLVGGDLLPSFPVRAENGRVLLDVTPPDPEERRIGRAATKAQRGRKLLACFRRRKVKGD
jgi:nitrite reductase/ring-hydroxylating ferredoxin subunit